MAIVVVSNAGGSIAVGATYVGGVAPTNNDSIAFTPTSGNLNVDSIVNIQGFDFTNYVGIINFTQPITINSPSNSHFINLGTGGYTLTGTPEIKYSNITAAAALSLTSNATAWTGILNLACNISNNNITLVDDWNQNGEFKTAANVNIRFLGVKNFNINGICNGDGAGALSFNQLNTATVNLNGTVNLSVGLGFDGGKLKYISGIANIASVFSSPTSLLTVVLDVSAINFQIAGISAGTNSNVQLDSVLNSGSLDLDGIFNFTGAFGYVADSLSINLTSPPTITYQSGVEYIVNDLIDISGATFLASVAGVKAKFTLGQNIDQRAVVQITATDIDSSGGRRVNNWYGTATNCDNWLVLNDNTLPQAPSTF
jgi:hypothetical protein